MHPPARAALTLFVLGIAASAASAQEYCVICTAPDAKYRCSIGGEPSIAAGASRGQLLCITELARTGGHASCSVGRNSGEPCEGEARTVMFPPSTDPAAPVVEVHPELPPAEGAPPAAPVAPLAPAEAPPQPPQQQPAPPATPPEEAQGSGNQLGNAMKKSWDCLSSLFSAC
jgi:hypothetical protein